MLHLPKSDEKGPTVSYSQINLWNSLEGFDLKASGKYEYILKYFFGHEFPDNMMSIFADFGVEVEDFITEGKSAHMFTAEEQYLLKKVPILGGTFQQKVELELPENIRLIGYIDDCLNDLTIIDDIKTASYNSSQKYYKDDYYQLDIYGMWVKQQTGKYPTARVKIIERLGSPFKEGRSGLSVGENFWIHERELSDARSKMITDYIMSTCEDISKHYKAYLDLLAS